MILEVKVIPKASRNMVKKEGERIKAYVTAAPEKGKANKALIELLAAHFRVRKSDIRVVKGEHSQVKVVSINQTA